MKIRMYLRGLGLGIIVAALVLSLSNNKKQPSMTNAEIIAKAKELGMEEKNSTLAAEVIKPVEEVKPEEEMAQEQEVEQEKEAAQEEEVEQEEKIQPEPDEAVNEPEEKAEEEPKVDEKAEEPVVKAEKSEEKVEEEVKPVEENKPEDVKAEDNKKESDVPDPKGLEKKAEELAAKAKSETASDIRSKSRMTITIAKGSGSYTAAQLLENGGVIDNAPAFDQFLCRNGYDKKITAGTHEIPEGATYEEIAKILTTR